MGFFKINRKQINVSDAGRAGFMYHGYSIRTLLIILVLFFMACDSSNANGPQGQARVKQLIENGALVVDVRTQQETLFVGSRIRGDRRQKSSAVQHIGRFENTDQRRCLGGLTVDLQAIPLDLQSLHPGVHR